ncbi:MAG: nickel pincer cofactor biosynthesis protein LarC [Myxococcota bacterium]
MLHLDTFSGIAGNMFLGALLDLGLSRRQLQQDLAGLGLDHALRVSRVRRGALAARYVRVQVPRKASGSSKRHGRHWSEIRRLIERARLPEPVRERALRIFEGLAVAEGRVHGIDPERVHFHEVGAVDAIVDVVGAASALYRLGIERVSASPVALGEGTVETAHGRLPLPAPATLELLRGIPTAPAHVAFETVTPTGAAILREVAGSFGPLPAMTILAVGHGAGDDRESPMPNVLRAVLGRDEAWQADRVVSLEANLDDLVPEHFDHVMERLFEAGALDVSLHPLQMKKNRPGFEVRVLAPPARRTELAAVLLTETSTLGLRVSECERIVLPRKTHRIRTPQGMVAVKVVRRPDGRVDVSAEYDDCKRIARRSGVPLREVVRHAEDQARAELPE